MGAQFSWMFVSKHQGDLEHWVLQESSFVFVGPQDGLQE